MILLKDVRKRVFLSSKLDVRMKWIEAKIWRNICMQLSVGCTQFAQQANNKHITNWLIFAYTQAGLLTFVRKVAEKSSLNVDSRCFGTYPSKLFQFVVSSTPTYIDEKSWSDISVHNKDYIVKSSTSRNLLKWKSSSSIPSSSPEWRIKMGDKREWRKPWTRIADEHWQYFNLCIYIYEEMWFNHHR